MIYAWEECNKDCTKSLVGDKTRWFSVLPDLVSEKNGHSDCKVNCSRLKCFFKTKVRPYSIFCAQVKVRIRIFWTVFVKIPEIHISNIVWVYDRDLRNYYLGFQQWENSTLVKEWFFKMSKRASQSISLLLGWAISPFACRTAQCDKLTVPL